MSNESAPRVWVLLGYGAGGNGQLLGLARALGWPFEAKHIRYNALNRIPNLLLGATGATLDAKHSDRLEPPWPDLVIAASRRAAPLARWIREQSGGHTRLVHLLHAQMPLRHFDLVVTTAQYRLPQRTNVLHNLLPLNLPLATDLATAAAHWQPRLGHLPRPWIAALIGGNSSSYRLDAEVATQLLQYAEDLALAAGGSVLISTSPRTPPDAAMAISQKLRCPTYVYRWDEKSGSDNPYLGFLALADRFMVTCDSASLLAEACATGRPVTLLEWPTRRQWLIRVMATLMRIPGMPALQQALIAWGVIKPQRDFHALHQAMRSHGLLDVPTHLAPTPPPNDLGRTVQRIRQLMANPGVSRNPSDPTTSPQA